jgi:hypothetical protein
MTLSDCESYYSVDSTIDDMNGFFDSSYYTFNEKDPDYYDNKDEDIMIKPIFKGANVNLKEFCMIFVMLVRRLRLSLIEIFF